MEGLETKPRVIPWTYMQVDYNDQLTLEDGITNIQSKVPDIGIKNNDAHPN